MAVRQEEFIWWQKKREERDFDEEIGAVGAGLDVQPHRGGDSMQACQRGSLLGELTKIPGATIF